MSDKVQTTFKRYICELCGARYSAGGECSTCEGVRLRDLADPAVQTWIASQDACRRNQRLQTIALVSPVLAVPVAYFLPRVLGQLPVGIEVTWLVSTLLIAGLASWIFPASKLAPKLTDDEQRTLRAIYQERQRQRKELSPSPPQDEPKAKPVGA